MSVSENPVHPFEVRISIGGEDWDYVVSQMRELMQYVANRKPSECQGFGGGGGGSYSITTTTRDISPEQFRRELDEWFEKQPRPERVA